jgi:hypothetical protein
MKLIEQYNLRDCDVGITGGKDLWNVPLVGLRCHDTRMHTNFHKDRLRCSEVIKGEIHIETHRYTHRQQDYVIKSNFYFLKIREVDWESQFVIGDTNLHKRQLSWSKWVKFEFMALGSSIHSHGEFLLWQRIISMSTNIVDSSALCWKERRSNTVCFSCVLNKNGADVFFRLLFQNLLVVRFNTHSCAGQTVYSFSRRSWLETLQCKTSN